jgi:hypothetical protein
MSLKYRSLAWHFDCPCSPNTSERSVDVHLSAIPILLAICAGLFGATAPDTFHWSGRVAPGQLLEIRNVNGSIHAEPAKDETVDVLAYRTGANRGALAGIQVLELKGGGVSISAPPSDDAAIAQVDFDVRVPRGVRFVARTVNGQVQARSLEADTEVHTVNGDVLLSTDHGAKGDTVNGTIDATVGRIDEATRFSTVNGAITLAMPSCVRAHVRATTRNGVIHSEFPLDVHGVSPGREARGHIGRGGAELTVDTVNGAIRLKQKKGA